MELRTLGIAVIAVLILMPFTSYGLGKADIAVIDVGVNSKCNWVVTMTNVGNMHGHPLIILIKVS
jgi:hypothetical protein